MRRNRQAGQALYITAASLVVLMGFLGLGIDMGALRYEKRLQQTAADAAALAGANNLGHGGITVGAQNASATNGFTDNGGGQVSDCGASAAVGTVCVQVNNPPQAGPHSGNTNYVEVLVSAVHSTYFMRVFGVTQETVTARAVATNLSGSGPNSGCLYTLGAPTDQIEGVNVNGNPTVNATTCGIVDNGNFNTQGNALNINAGTFGISGSWNASGPGGTVTCTATPSSCPTAGMPAASDPFSYLTPPAQPNPNYGSKTTSGTTTLQPGTYSDITFGKNSTTTLSPGIYYIDGSGGVTFNGAATVTGNGVMFYFTNGATINATGGGDKLDMQLTAPSASNCPACASEYDGILFYQDPNDAAAPSLGGDDSSKFDGVLYFPQVEITFFGHGTSYNAGIVVAAAFALSGDPTVNLQGEAGLPTGVELATVATLVE